jgi:hypothetical protein
MSEYIRNEGKNGVENKGGRKIKNLIFAESPEAGKPGKKTPNS